MELLWENHSEATIPLQHRPGERLKSQSQKSQFPSQQNLWDPPCLTPQSKSFSQQDPFPHQVINLVVPSAGNEDDLSGFLDDFQRGLALAVARIHPFIPKIWSCHVKGEVPVAILEEFLLSCRVQQPFLPAAHVGRPAVRAEDVGVERSPGKIRDGRESKSQKVPTGIPGVEVLIPEFFLEFGLDDGVLGIKMPLYGN